MGMDRKAGADQEGRLIDPRADTKVRKSVLLLKLWTLHTRCASCSPDGGVAGSSKHTGRCAVSCACL